MLCLYLAPLFILFAFGLVVLIQAAHAQGPIPANYDESKVGSYTLPDPLTFNNGEKVTNARQWERRREELLELFAENVYGRSPAPPKHINFNVFDFDKKAFGGKAIRPEFTLH